MKLIRIDEEVDDAILRVQRPRESYNDALRRLIGLDVEEDERRSQAGQEARQAS